MAPEAEAVACVVAQVMGVHVEELIEPRLGVCPPTVGGVALQLLFQGVDGVHSSAKVAGRLEEVPC
jgi:hypothetical protein